MERIVVDASVALKWFFRDRADESDTGLAVELLRAISDGRIRAVQPPHFVAEVAAVLAREAPAMAREGVRDLLEVDLECVDDSAAVPLAVDLAMRFQAHVFDTLYHAVALQHAAVLVSADRRYLRKAREAGSLVLLQEFIVPQR